jgi:UDP-N-acetylmuramate--alanine ligase
MGARIFRGHSAENIDQADLVVVSSAIPPTNPEVVAAQERSLPIIQRAQMLGLLMRERFGVAVAGTHGKTTTTSMLASILEHNGLEPTVIIGGEVNDIGGNAKLGQGHYLVAEADESDASFLHLAPRIAVVTSIDSDVNVSARAFAECNYDYEATMARVEEIFLQFMQAIPEDGLLVLCSDNERLRRLIPGLRRPYTTYGLGEGASLRAVDIEFCGFGSRCRVVWEGRELGELRLRVPGNHNIQDALGAMAVALRLGLDFSAIAEVLAGFEGARRRFQVLGTCQGVTVVDDYAHNPAKVRAALHAARHCAQDRVLAVFQPHRYTRTKFLGHEFADAFGDADILCVTDIYSAGETPILGVKAESIVEAVRGHGRPTRVYYTPGHKEALDFLVAQCQPGDLVITLGAGDIHLVASALVERLSNPALRKAAI